MDSLNHSYLYFHIIYTNLSEIDYFCVVGCYITSWATESFTVLGFVVVAVAALVFHPALPSFMLNIMFF